MMFPKQNAVSVCSVEGCNNAHLAKGLCNMHYLRMKISGSTNAPQRKLKDPREILLSRSVTTESGCIEWTGALREGYGRLVVNKKYHSAHVLSWQLDHGEIPAGFQLNHKCHNRACINVDHLYLGTQLQNMADMRNAGREKRPKGRDFSTTKLTEVNVLAIRASEKSIASIAREYLVSESLIRAIKKREAWAWLGDAALARPKSNPVRSEEYRRLVASMSCKACGIQGYSQAAHVPPDGRGCLLIKKLRSFYV